MKKINGILVYILIFFIIFASALNYTYLPSFISYIKDIIIFYFVLVLIVNRKFKLPKDIGISFYILFVLIASISWLGLIFGTNNEPVTVIIRILRYLEFFVLFFIFGNLEILCDVSYKKLIKFYIMLSTVLIFVHIFGYFVPNNIVSIYIDNKIGNGYYRNRISIGQPAIAVYPMIVSYFYLLIYKSEKGTILNIVLLILGIIISVSTTGILTVGLITLLIMIPIGINNKKYYKRIACIALGLLIIFVIAILVVMNIPSLKSIYLAQKDLLHIKIGALYRDNLTDLSMKTRDIKYEQIMNNIDDHWIKKVFGVGMLGQNSEDINIGSMENTYRTMRVFYGTIGLVTFLGFLLQNMYKSIKQIRNIDNIFIIVLFLVFALHSYTLEVLYIPTISYSLPFFYCFVKDGKRGEQKDENINC